MPRAISNRAANLRCFAPPLITLILFTGAFQLYVNAEKTLDHVYATRTKSFMLAGELRQSSDDLTRMVRTYVATSNPLYKQHYQEILDIREGKIARPIGYQYVYWDLVLDDDSRPSSKGKAESLLELMRQAGFTEQEFAKLAEAKANSDQLTQTEFQAMALIEKENHSLADRELAISLLHNLAYHQAKKAIMLPIQLFEVAVDQRMQAAIDDAVQYAKTTRLIFALLGGAMVLSFGFTFQTLRREKQLKSVSEARYHSELIKSQTLLRNASDGFHILTLDGDVIDASDAFCAMLGYSRDEVIGMNVRQWDAQIPADAINSVIRHHYQQPGRFEFCTRHRRKDGSIFDADISGYPLQLNGQPVVIYASRDFTERKHLEEELRLSEQRFKDLAHTIGDWIWEIDTNGRYVFVSEKIQDCLGYEPNELLGKTPFDFMPSDEAKRIETIFGHILENRQIFKDLDNAVLHKNGSLRHVLTSGVPILANDGTLLGYRGTDKDITEKIEAQNKLREEEARLRLVLNSTAEGILALDAENQCLFANQSCLALLGYAAETDIIGKRVDELVYPAPPLLSSSRHAQCPLQARLNQEIHVDIDYFQRREGSLFPVEYWSRPVLRDEKFVGAIVTFVDISTRQEQEKKMRLADQALRHSNVATYLVNIDGEIIDVNQASCDMLGYSRDELMTMTVADIEDETTPDIWRAHVAEYKRLGTVRIESSLLAKNGDHIPVELSIAYFESYGSEFILGLASDISERKRNEKINKQYQAIVQSSEDAIIAKSLDGLITSWNPGAEKTFGYSADEMLGQRCIRLFPTERQQEEAEILKHIRAGETITHLESERVRKDGEVISISTTISPIHDEQGRIVGASLITRDVTASKRAEMELNNYRQHLEELVESRTIELTRLNNLLLDTQFAMESVGIGIETADYASGRFIYANRFACGLLGYSQDQFLQLSVSDIDPNFPPEAYNDIKQVIRQRGQIQFETQQKKQSGELIPVEVSIFYQRAREESQEKFIAFVTDITRRKESEQALKQAKEEAETAASLKSHFLANMSHEIRTPMNAVLGFCQLLEQRPLDNDAKQLVHKIHTAGHSLLAIINDILDFSKIEAGRLGIENEPFALPELLDELAALMAVYASRKNLELAIIPPPMVDGIAGDRQRLQQVLVNLLGNAIKFTETGEVELRIEVCQTATHSEALRFKVRDTGMGISPEKQAEIFSAFSQGDSSISRRFGGTGLGLAISQQLVELMGGKLEVVSEEGVGSEFSFILPLVRRPIATKELLNLNHLDILVADDSSTAREALTYTAKNLGWDCEAVDSGEAALLQVLARWENQQPYDVLLLDWQMPGQDGLATAQAIQENLARKYDEQTKVPIVIMVTAFDREELAAQPGVAWVDNVISKPVTTSNLYNAILEVLNKKDPIRPSKPQERDGESMLQIPGVRVLVVDDSEANLELAQLILESEGAVVHTVANGQKALDWLHAHPDGVDLVLMDIQMPVMDGYTATQKIRQNEQWQNLPIVALSAGVLKEERDKALAKGMVDFVAKPLDVAQLIATIQNLTRCEPQRATLRKAIELNQRNSADFPGLNINFALNQWHDVNAYNQHLLKFIADYADAQQRLAEMLARRQLDEAARMIHKLKGVAGNLGLQNMVNIAQQLETDLKSGTIALAQLDTFQQAIDQAKRSIAAWQATLQPAFSTSDVDMSMQPGLPTLELLEQLLHALDQDSPAASEPIVEQLKSRLSAEDIAEIQELLATYRFRKAEAMVSTWIQTLKQRERPH